LLENSQLEPILHKISEMGTKLLEFILAVKEKCLLEISETRTLLEKHRMLIPAIDVILKTCDKVEAIRAPQSHELIPFS
jgi:hypothetical protein